MKSIYDSQMSQFSMLNTGQCEEILSGALEILECTGIEVNSAQVSGIFKDSGCRIEGTRVRIPANIVQRSIDSAPRRMVLSDKNGNPSLFLEATNSYFGAGSDLPFVMNSSFGVRRTATQKDNEILAKVSNNLKNIDFISGFNGLPPVETFSTLMKHTTKPLIQSFYNAKQGQEILNLGRKEAGSNFNIQDDPFFAFKAESTLPLADNKAWEKVIFAAENKMPMIYCLEASAGDLLPATMSGALVLALADCLAALVISQLASPGASIALGGKLGSINNSTDCSSIGGPEHSILAAGFTNLANYLKIPSIARGGSSDAKVIDAQSSIESAFSILAAALSGANLVTGCNSIEFGSISSLDMLVMNDEIIGMVKRILNGIEINDAKAPLDILDEFGPGEPFPSSEHSMKFLPSETRCPSIINRNRYDDWVANGSKPLLKRVKEKTALLSSCYQG